MRYNILVALAFAGWALPASAIDFHPSIEDARNADDRDRPIVLSFGAGWCGWCRKMNFETFADSKVEQVADQFLWVKVDIDKQRELAARFRVHGVPQTIVLDAQERLLGAQGGYMPAERFVAFLNESLENPSPEELLPASLRRLAESKSADEQRDAVAQLVERLARPDRHQRQEILDALKQEGSEVWPVLADLLNDGRLSVRAAAAGALKHSTSAELPYHPFASRQLRSKQCGAWRSWIDLNTVNKTTDQD